MSFHSKLSHPITIFGVVAGIISASFVARDSAAARRAQANIELLDAQLGLLKSQDMRGVESRFPSVASEARIEAHQMRGRERRLDYDWIVPPAPTHRSVASIVPPRS